MTTRENSKRCYFRVSAFKNTTRIQPKDSQEREERMKIVAGEGKKARNFGRSGGGVSGGVMTDFGQSNLGRTIFGHRVLPANFGIFDHRVFPIFANTFWAKIGV